MYVLCFKLIPHINIKENASVLLQVNPQQNSNHLFGEVLQVLQGVKIFQPPLQYFIPLVIDIGESLSRATPERMYTAKFKLHHGPLADVVFGVGHLAIGVSLL